MACGEKFDVDDQWAFCSDTWAGFAVELSSLRRDVDRKNAEGLQGIVGSLERIDVTTSLRYSRTILSWHLKLNSTERAIGWVARIIDFHRYWKLSLGCL
jgi:hypothetical protein